MNPIPTTVKVGHVRYEIVADRKRLHSVEPGVSGVTALEEQVISVDPERGADAVARTVLHEVLHAVWANAGDRSDKVDEETAIKTIAPGLLLALRDNPLLIGYLTNG